MGNFKYLLGGAIAALGFASVAAAQAQVVSITVSDGHSTSSPWTGESGVEDASPSGAGAALFSYSEPLDRVNNDPNLVSAHRGSEANGSPSSAIFGLELPETPTWAMFALGIAGLGFAAFRSPRKRDVSLFS
ncbi:MAG TPA: hypothetical protein VJY34_05005 [Roseiarcus sp.]|nr:hypothetical protein [Roseiarcus sp.]